MAAELQGILHAWRESERLLERLPPLDPDHETVAMIVAELRRLYALTERRHRETTARIEDSGAVLDQAWAVIRAAQARIDGTDRR